MCMYIYIYIYICIYTHTYSAEGARAQRRRTTKQVAKSATKTSMNNLYNITTKKQRSEHRKQHTVI